MERKRVAVKRNVKKGLTKEDLARRHKPSPERLAQAMAFLNHPKGIEPDPEDQLPEGYVSSLPKFDASRDLDTEASKHPAPSKSS